MAELRSIYSIYLFMCSVYRHLLAYLFWGELCNPFLDRRIDTTNEACQEKGLQNPVREPWEATVKNILYYILYILLSHPFKPLFAQGSRAAKQQLEFTCYSNTPKSRVVDNVLGMTVGYY